MPEVADEDIEPELSCHPPNSILQVVGGQEATSSIQECLDLEFSHNCYNNYVVYHSFHAATFLAATGGVQSSQAHHLGVTD